MVINNRWTTGKHCLSNEPQTLEEIETDMRNAARAEALSYLSPLELEVLGKFLDFVEHFGATDPDAGKLPPGELTTYELRVLCWFRTLSPDEQCIAVHFINNRFGFDL